MTAACVCYLQRCWLLLHWSDEDHQFVVNAQVAEDVALWHGDMKLQDLQHVIDRYWLVPVQLHTEVKGHKE